MVDISTVDGTDTSRLICRSISTNDMDQIIDSPMISVIYELIQTLSCDSVEKLENTFCEFFAETAGSYTIGSEKYASTIKAVLDQTRSKYCLPSTKKENLSPCDACVDKNNFEEQPDATASTDENNKNNNKINKNNKKNATYKSDLLSVDQTNNYGVSNKSSAAQSVDTSFTVVEMNLSILEAIHCRFIQISHSDGYVIGIELYIRLVRFLLSHTNGQLALETLLRTSEHAIIESMSLDESYCARRAAIKSPVLTPSGCILPTEDLFMSHTPTIDQEKSVMETTFPLAPQRGNILHAFTSTNSLELVQILYNVVNDSTQAFASAEIYKTVDVSVDENTTVFIHPEITIHFLWLQLLYSQTLYGGYTAYFLATDQNLLKLLFVTADEERLKFLRRIETDETYRLYFVQRRDKLLEHATNIGNSCGSDTLNYELDNENWTDRDENNCLFSMYGFFKYAMDIPMSEVTNKYGVNARDGNKVLKTLPDNWALLI